MAKSAHIQSFMLTGPVGRLQALLEAPSEGDVAGVVVVCHPHPLHGGTMNNKVAHTLARSFVRLGFAALRFNFRGTEQSDGEFDDGEGEMDDVRAALEYCRQHYPGQCLWLAGFSFGAAVAVKVAATADVDGLVSVAPAIRRFATGMERAPTCPWLVVQGDRDELVDIDDTVEWVNGLEPGPELAVIEDAEHFFHGRLVLLRELVSTFVVAHLAPQKSRG